MDYVAGQLFDAWQQMPDPWHVGPVLEGVAEPASMALRSRYIVLRDEALVDVEEIRYDESLDLWERQLGLDSDGDEALRRGDFDVAKAAFAALGETWEDGRHPLPFVHAELGLGEVDRHLERYEQALTHYERALRVARPHYRFGELRVRVSLGYLILLGRSSLDAEEQFDEAARIARELGDRMYEGNALLGLGETRSRRHEVEQAEAVYRASLAAFEQVGSLIGVGNACQRLGDLLMRHDRSDAAVQLLERACECFAEVENPLGACNAAETLAELHLRAKRPTEAMPWYERALALAERGRYVRGIAHCCDGLARCAIELDRPEAAEVWIARARQIFDSLDDLSGQASAIDVLALIAQRRDDAAGRLAHRLDGVELVERWRARNDRHVVQQEFRTRFFRTYRAAFEAAVLANDVGGFVFVLENYAGRRLAGLIEGVGADSSAVELVSDLLARAEQAGPVGKHWVRPERGGERQDELHRRLGALALRGALPDVATRELDDLVAALYRPCTRERASELVAGMPEDQLTAAVVRLPDDDRIGWAIWLPDGGASIGFTSITTEAMKLLKRLASQGLSAQDTLRTLAPLVDLLPEPLAAALAQKQFPRTTLIPIGDLWSVPWNAVQVREGTVLGAVTALTIAPSLTVLSGVRTSRGSVAAAPIEVKWWRSPQIRGHRMLGLRSQGWHAHALTDASEAVAALTDGLTPFVVAAGHGIPVTSIGHYLELDPSTPLTPAGLLGGTCPDRAVLIACWGAGYPQAEMADPLSLATIALARGARQVAATVGELGDGGPANRFVDSFLHRIPQVGMPEALRLATEKHLGLPQFHHTSIVNWAPLTIVGAHLNHP